MCFGTATPDRRNNQSLTSNVQKVVYVGRPSELQPLKDKCICTRRLSLGNYSFSYEFSCSRMKHYYLRI